MARRENELFIGKEFLNIQGRSVKHPALISEYGNINLGKLDDSPFDTIGLDLETNHLTGELKLLGFWNGSDYWYKTDKFISSMFQVIKYADRKNRALVYWNRLDPFVLYKQFLLLFQEWDPDDKEQRIIKALDRFGKTGGVWNRKLSHWDVAPLVEIEIGDFRFGIKNVIRSSLQFFYYRKGSEYCNTVWAFDIAQLYQKGLESEMMSRKDLFPYYSKVDESAHLVDWPRFASEVQYREQVVLKSNKLDAMAVYDLAQLIQSMFYNAFGFYPRTLVSTGSIARASLVAVIINKYKNLGMTEKEYKKLVIEDVKSIGFMNYYDDYYKQLGDYGLKDFYSLTTESYSGGEIESLRYGYTKKAWFSDIASAYPYHISQLWDLRGSKITTGTGPPPRIKNSYCFIRGEVNIPRSVNVHPITIKHPLFDETNIRATGEYMASYLLEERDYVESLGATFHNEVWYNVETKGELSPIAKAVIQFVELRQELLAKGDTAQYVAKISANSMYGILFECVDKYIDDADGFVERVGFRAGEFFNPLYASIITARTRIQVSKASNEIEKAGGKPILIMTDSVFWEGTSNMLPENMVKDVKTLGYFETPEMVTEMVCLGTGRYSYTNSKGFISSKKRGLNVTAFHSDSGIVAESFNWNNALDIIRKTNKPIIDVSVRALVSIGMVKGSKKWTIKDLGRVVEEVRTVDVITGLSKRLLKNRPKNINVICDTMIDTEPLDIGVGIMGDGKIVDRTLSKLREKMQEKPVQTAGDIDKVNRTKASTKYNMKSNVAERRKKRQNKKYHALKKYGYDSKERRIMCKWNDDKIMAKLKEDCKL